MAKPLLERLVARYPDIKFTPGKQFSWSPGKHTVIYVPGGADWSLLHETAHGLLDHRGYASDIELIQMERAAWDRAAQLAAELELPAIDPDHIEDCLDTYRDWLYKRSCCPRCSVQGLQELDGKHYRCHNCHERWRVSGSRFARAYRRSSGAAAGASQNINFQEAHQ